MIIIIITTTTTTVVVVVVVVHVVIVRPLWYTGPPDSHQPELNIAELL